MDMKKMFMELYKEKYGEHINRELAESLVQEMAVTDGSGRETGERWNIEESKIMGDKLGVSWDKVNKIEWYLVLNMMYSDYFRTIKKYGQNESIYADLAWDWFCDVDAEDDKTFNFFMCL